jgi:pseudaminic acid cytidylyltransferase
MTRRLAVVPARGGSKRIPNKNVRAFCGRPMIGHILETARESGLFDVIHVSTESAAIKREVEKLGFVVDFMRPDELADDHTPIMPVLKFVADTYAARQQLFDEVWLLMACSPFVEASDLRGAADRLRDIGARHPVMAVARYPVPVEWAYRLEPDGRLTPTQPGMFAVRSQDIEPKYFDTGTFIAFPTSVVRSSQGAGSDAHFVGHVIDRRKAVDIDDEEDWALAESMFEHFAGTPKGAGAAPG